MLDIYLWTSNILTLILGIAWSGKDLFNLLVKTVLIIDGIIGLVILTLANIKLC